MCWEKALGTNLLIHPNPQTLGHKMESWEQKRKADDVVRFQCACSDGNVAVAQELYSDIEHKFTDQELLETVKNFCYAGFIK